MRNRHIWNRTDDGTDWRKRPCFERDKHGTNVIQLIDLEIEWGREYDLLLFVEGTSVKNFVDEQAIHDVTVKDDVTGTISLATYGYRAIARFRDPKIRVG